MSAKRSSLLAALGIAAFAGSASAENLIMGVAYDPQTIDPHIRFFTGSNQAFQHVFETLIFRNKDLELEPALAGSWKLIDDKTWEIKLRSGVKWHDGSPFTADDVLFNVQRSPNVPGAIASSGRFLVQNGKQWKKIDDLTLHVTTQKAYPVMPRDLSVTQLVQKKAADGATSADFESGKAAIGTGPYRFGEYLRGEQMTFKANPTWWQAKPKWDNVTFKIIASNPTRVAALLSGSVDVIDNLPPEDVEVLKKNSRVAVHTAATNRLIYLLPDVNKDFTPKITANDGSEIRNPLRDWRVRKAISKAINRDAIVERVMASVAVPGSQFMAPGHSGNNPDIKVEAYDPDGAKKLLTEAGYPQGFKLTLNASDVAINGLKIGEAIVQMLNRVGIKAELEAVPSQTYWTKMRAGEMSIGVTSWISSNGESGDPLLQAFHTWWPSDQLGGVNMMQYSNRRLDEMIDKYAFEMDPAKRIKMIHDAYTIATGDVAYVPLHWEMGLYASRPDINYVVRRDQYTLAENASKK